jgi:hypothetical protein
MWFLSIGTLTGQIPAIDTTRIVANLVAHARAVGLRLDCAGRELDLRAVDR